MKIIRLCDLISKYPAYRTTADNLFKIINGNDDNNIQIDFANVIGITHSFASQYKKNKSLCNKIVKEVNENENVLKMFQILDKPKRPIKNNNIERKISGVQWYGTL